VAGGVIALALVAGLGGGYFMKDTRRVTAEAKLQIALQAFRSGNDASALSLLTPLADEGNAEAQYWLADIYEDDDPNVKPDLVKAQALLEKSAAQGFVPAERQLGQLYLRGTATLQDFGKAQSWLHKAATAGDARAQEELGRIYALGLGVPKDTVQAYGWYENAAVHADGLAERMRDDLVKRMSPTEIDKGVQTAKEIAASIKPTKS
jgi:TPR repeat protein